MNKEKPKEIDYKLKLMQILDCVGTQEGIIFDGDWETYGVSEEERIIILEEERRHPKRWRNLNK